jgi:hypothetical protein
VLIAATSPAITCVGDVTLTHSPDPVTVTTSEREKLGAGSWKKRLLNKGV